MIPGHVFTALTARSHEKPPGAWTAEQTVDFMIARIDAGDFYILCPDNDVPRPLDERRMLWAAGDIVENRRAVALASGLCGGVCEVREGFARRVGRQIRRATIVLRGKKWWARCAPPYNRDLQRHLLVAALLADIFDAGLRLFRLTRFGAPHLPQLPRSRCCPA
jgi:hypothetical protein